MHVSLDSICCLQSTYSIFMPISASRGVRGGREALGQSPLPLQQATFFFPPSEVTAKSKCRRLCQIFQVVASAAAEAACIPSAATLGIVEEGEGREAVAAAAALA